MTDYFKIVYAYRFDSGASMKFDVLLDSDTLDILPEKDRDLPEWTLLGYCQCAICPLDARSHPRCPVAANISGMVEKFKNFTSHDQVSVACIVDERTYSKKTTVQMGVSSLLGIIMTTSGCPVMAQLKPMVRFHLPFASLEETIFRMVSMHLVAQYLRHQAGKSSEWSLNGLIRIYGQVGEVNRDFADRMVGGQKRRERERSREPRCIREDGPPCRR